MTFDCPFCNWESDDFDETEEHYIEHISDYQSKQNDEFGKYTS